MDGLEVSIGLTILGALLGAIVSPAVEVILRRCLNEEGNWAQTGFVLLCSANGLWLLSYLLFPIAKNTLGLVILGGLFAVATGLFIAAFQSFRAVEAASTVECFWRSVRFLAMGNFFWLLAEASEAPLAFMQLDHFPYLFIKYVLFIPALGSFIFAGRSAWRHDGS